MSNFDVIAKPAPAGSGSGGNTGGGVPGVPGMGGTSNFDVVASGGSSNYSPEPTGEKTTKELPPGAIDFLPNGEAYYGDEGFMGWNSWANGAKARLSEQSYARLEDGTYTPVDTRPLQYAARGIKEGVGALMKGVTDVQEVFQGALSIDETIEDIANESGSFLPNLDRDKSAVEKLGSIAGGSIVDTIYNTARIFTGSRKLAWDDIEQIARENALLSSKLAGTEIVGGALRDLGITEDTKVGSAIMNSEFGKNLYNANLRAEFLRRYRAGENADKLVAEYANPFAELGYDLVVDPFNVIGLFADDAVKMAKLAETTKRFETLDDLKDGWNAVKTAQTVEQADPVFLDMAGKILNHNLSSAEKLADTSGLVNPVNKWLSKGAFSETGLFSPARLTASGRADQAADVIDNMFKPLMGAFGKDPDGFGEVLRAMSLMGGTNVDEIKEGLQIATRLGQGIAQFVTSPDGMQTAQFLNKAMASGSLVDDLMDAMKTGKKIPEIVEKWGKVSDKVFKEMYPSVIEMAEADKALVAAGKEKLYNIPDFALKVAQATEKMQSVTRPMNKIFSTVYITTNPGAGFRNLMNNALTAAVDFGPSVAAKGMKGFGQRVLTSADDILGAIRELMGLPAGVDMRAAVRGVTGRVGQIEDVSLGKKLGGLMNAGEEAMGAAIYYASAKRTLNKAFKEGMAISDLTPLRNMGIPEEGVQRLIGLMQSDPAHDAGRALEKWTSEMGDGVVDTWRDIRTVLHPLDIDQARGVEGLLETMEKALDAPTKDDALRIVQEWRDGWAEKASKADGLLPSFRDGKNPDVLEAVVNDGFDEATATAFDIKLRAQQAGNEKLLEAGEKTFNNLMTEVNDPVFRQQLKVFREELFNTRKVILQEAQHAPLRNVVVDGLMHNGALKNDQKLLSAAQKLLHGTKDYPSLSKWLLDNPIGENGVRDAIWKYYFTSKDAAYKAQLGHYLDAYTEMFSRPDFIQIAGRNVLGDDTMKIGKEAVDEAVSIMNADLITKDGIWIDRVNQALKAEKPKDAIRALAGRFGITSRKAEKTTADAHILNIINKYPSSEDAAKFTSLDEVPFDTAQTAFKTRKEAKAGEVIPEAAKLAENVPAPGLEKFAHDVFEDLMPSPGQAARGNQKGINAILDRFEAGLNSRWGKGTAVGKLTPDQVAAAMEWQKETIGRTAQARAIAGKIAQQERDFALLNYGQKTSLDNALGFVFPYQFWYNRSFQNWAKRLATHPEVISRYANYRQWLEQEHANLPEWWRYNVSINDLPGVNVENPLFMNLEATLNPLNGITGVDFNDPNKIVGDPGTGEYMWTSLLNDAGKFGPSIWSPLTMLTAAYLGAAGHQDAAQRWAGRLIPQTAFVKAVAAKAGMNLELDPLVMIASGKGPQTAADAYETRRVGRMLYALGETGDAQGKITPEQALEAARTQKGPIWERALLMASQDRSSGQIMSSLFGVGFKQRTPADMEIDKFYEDYNALWRDEARITPQQFKMEMDKLRFTYPFMDTILLSKKGGIERDRAYAYTVLGRIAPGQSTEIFKALGLDGDIMDKFYAEKGKIGAWTEDDRSRFMGAIISIGTTLAIPSDTTQREWTQARNAYSTMNEQMKKQFGSDILDKVETWYAYQNTKDKDIYLRNHPEVQQALDFKAYQVARTPVLSAYYNGMANIEDYWKGEKRKDVLLKLGPDYYDLLKQREGLFTKQELAAFDRQHPQLKKYSALSKKWDAFIDRKILQYGLTLPVAQGSVKQNVVLESVGQKAVAQAIEPKQKVQWSEISPTIPDNLKDAIGRYFQDGRPLSSAEKTVLSRYAAFFDLSTDEVMGAAASAIGQ